MVERLLGEHHIDGQFPIIRDVGPELLAFLVDADDLDDARQVIRECCGTWGGGVWPLIPFEHGALRPAPEWFPLLDDATIDGVVARGFVDSSHYTARMRRTRLESHPGGNAIWPIAEADRQITGERSQLQLRLPPIDHPWYVAYLACFGDLDERLSPATLRLAGLRENVTLAELADIHAGPAPAPGFRDLVQTLRGPRYSPRYLSLRALGLASAGWSQDLVTAPTWTMRHWSRQFVGSNIAVVYEPGSVPDLCLAWNLRAAHGLPDGLPLAVPVADAAEALRAWGRPDDGNEDFAGRLRGIGRPFALTSLTVSEEQLRELAWILQ